MNFTDEQQKIFEFVGSQAGHGIIDAVAGAGKTTTMMQCANYVDDRSKILFCAFNTSIAKEISKKFHRLGIDDVTVKTIHALGRQILQDNFGRTIRLVEPKYRKLLSDEILLRSIRPYFEIIFNIHGLSKESLNDKRNFAATNLLDRITFKLLEANQKFRATLSRDDVSEFEKLVIHFGIFNDFEISRFDFKEEINAYFEAHRLLLQAGNGLARKRMIIDYTDMLYLPCRWNIQPFKKYEYVFIDECQDLSKAQFAVAMKYSKKQGRILAVGDPRQSIYGFTGADIDSFNRIKDFTKARVWRLTKCFRCPQKVIELARSIRPDIIGSIPSEGIVGSIQFEDVVSKAQPGDLILSRLRAPIVLLVFSFIDRDIKVRIHEDEVKEIITEIRNIFKQEELGLTIARHPGGFAQLKKTVLQRWRFIIQKNADAIFDNTERNIYEESEIAYLEAKLNFLHKKYEQWKEECWSINDLLKRIKKFISARSNAIKLSTIHRAKGLENERVFILNYDDLPYYRKRHKEWERTQEMNLKYVAITRAMSELFLVEKQKIETIEQDESLFDNLPFDTYESVTGGYSW